MILQDPKSREKGALGPGGTLILGLTSIYEILFPTFNRNFGKINLKNFTPRKLTKII